MSELRLLALYEYSHAGLPHGSAYLRLLQPMSYPTIHRRLQCLPSPFYAGQKADIVIINRHWRNDINQKMATALVDKIRANGSKIVYEIDDDLLNLPEQPTGKKDDQAACVRHFLQQADGVIVSTPVLRQRFAPLNPRIFTVKNALDERLLPTCGGNNLPYPFERTKIILGYMGTRTHDDDLRLLLPALSALARTAPLPLELQIIGGAASPETLSLLNQLPFPVIQLQPPSPEYPQFLPWFTGNVYWDVALAPLCDTPFNRAKSDIKFLDYAALGAAGVYSNLPVYAETVRHGETGLLAENTAESWAAALRSLIEQPDLRRKLATNARRYLYSERILARRATDWADALEAIHSTSAVQVWRG